LGDHVRAIANQMGDKETKRSFVVNGLKDLANQTQGDLIRFLESERAERQVGTIRSLWIQNVVGATVTPSVAAAVAARDDVEYLSYNRRVPIEDIYPFEIPDGAGPGNDSIECGVALMGADRVWNELGFTGAGVVIGHIDSGVCPTHPDIQNQIWTNVDEIPGNGLDDDNNGYIDDTWGWNFEFNNNNPDDSFGHGSHTAGTIAGDGTQGSQSGMAPDSEIMELRISGSFSMEQLVWDATQYAVDNGADLISASIGWPHFANPDRATWRAVCENAIAAGVVVIYAAGNEGCSTNFDNVRTPGDVPDVITVGATDCNDLKASFSSCGPVEWEFIPPYNDWPFPPGKIKPTIAAPGVNTVSHNRCSGYTTFSGTSMATPHVAGAVALMLEANPKLDHFSVKQILMDTSVDLGTSGRDNQFGAGRVDAYESVLAAGGITPSCMNLTVSDLFAGQTADFKVTKNTVRGDTVAIVWGLGGNETIIDNFAGYCATFGFDVPLDNAAKRIVAQGLVDQNGEFNAQRKIPAGTSGLNVLFQAAKRDTCPDECMSDIIEKVVQ